MDNVFSKLKTLPNAKVLDRRGDRIAFPYGETPLEDDIKMLLRKYDYNVLDFNNYFTNIHYKFEKYNPDSNYIFF